MTQYARTEDTPPLADNIIDIANSGSRSAILRITLDNNDLGKPVIEGVDRTISEMKIANIQVRYVLPTLLLAEHFNGALFPEFINGSKIGMAIKRWGEIGKLETPLDGKFIEAWKAAIPSMRNLLDKDEIGRINERRNNFAAMVSEPPKKHLLEDLNSRVVLSAWHDRELLARHLENMRVEIKNDFNASLRLGGEVEKGDIKAEAQKKTWKLKSLINPEDGGERSLLAYLRVLAYRGSDDFSNPPGVKEKYSSSPLRLHGGDELVVFVSKDVKGKEVILKSGMPKEPGAVYVLTPEQFLDEVREVEEHLRLNVSFARRQRLKNVDNDPRIS